MKTKNNSILFFIFVIAMVSFACRGGAGVAATATSVPPHATNAIQSPTEEPVQNSGELEIRSTASYIDSFNDYNVVGEIVNNTNDTIENITLSISIKDESGTTLLQDENEEPVETIDVQPYISVLVPGASAPFNYYISADDVQPADFEVTIKSYDSSSAPEPADIAIENVQSNETDAGDIVISGELINNSAQEVDVESLAGAILDDADTVLAANSTLTYSRYLAPAGDPNGRDRGPFIVRLFGPVQNAAQWKVYARAVENSNAPSTDMDIEYSNAYVDAYGSYHLLGWLKNNGSGQISPAVIAGLYDADKTVFDAASLNITTYLNPGETVPFDINAFQIIGSRPADQATPASQSIQPDLYWTFTTDYKVVALEATKVNITRDGSYWTVTGTVVNTSDKSLGSISAVVTFTDGDGKLLATSTTSMYPPDGANLIQPGDPSDFSTSLYVPEDWDLSTENYQILVQGVISQ